MSQYLCLFIHGAAVSCVVVGSGLFTSTLAEDRMLCSSAMVSSGKVGSLPMSQDRSNAEQAKVGAAIDQSVTLVLGGRYPAWTRGSCWTHDSQSSRSILQLICVSYWQPLKSFAKWNECLFFLLCKKETSSLAGSAGSLTLTESMIELTFHHPCKIQIKQERIADSDE